ncbi:hypothetical protein B0A54_12104 [Friedmanniomyces endolithicus]|uniref:Major facilitator superfamily (MFS) profile domain-containing protein n=1 Tax=Friedmanniomyces endolithicus TaxID=329885 RepID=A0A4U0UIN9_9PEZI|nr:hypothetical protein B0A54_12104 [Friedmanniomyces endolithicus]
MSTSQFELRAANESGLASEQTTATNDLTDALPAITDPSLTTTHDTSVPDGGYGWIAVLGCAVITWWFVGTTYSWGILQAALVRQGLSEASTLSFVGSLTVACIAFLAVANARIVTEIGAQKLGFLGVTLLGVGEVVAGFAVRDVGALFATVGVVMGVGTRYGEHGQRGHFEIIGILTLTTGLPAAWLIRERSPAKRTTFIEWRLFTSLKFDLLLLSGIIGTFPLLVPPFFLPLYCQSIALKPSVGAAMLATFNFSGALGRIGCGLLCDIIGPLNVLFATLLLTGISMLVLWPVSTTLVPLVMFAIWNGVASGGFFAVMPTVVGSIFGTQKMPIAMGMIVTGWAGGYLMGGPIAGYMLGRYGGVEGGVAAFRPAMYYAGSMSLGAAALVAFMRLRIESAIWRKL